MRTSLLCWLLPTLFLTACSKAATPLAPTEPANTPQAATPSAIDPNSFGFAVGDLALDLATSTATLTPVRSAAAIGDDYSELGLTPAFNKTFGDNFQVVGIRTPSPGVVEVDVQITHPFSPATRPDLGIFNVKCFVVTDRAPVGLDGVNIAPGVLSNADGYSDTWQLTHPASIPTFGPANVQPYVILREDPASAPFDFQNPSGWNVLFPGQTSTDTLAINIGSAATFQARLFLTADYGQSAVRATRQTPDYQLPKFAGNAPWKIEVTELTNDLEETDLGSTATYDVTIWDWKHGQSLGSDVTGATISVPGVTTAPVNLSLSGTGTDPTPLTATPLITNAAGAVEGDYIGIVTVNDAGQGVGLEENLTTPVSFGSYTTYMTFPVHVSNTVVVVPPTASTLRCLGGDLGVGIIETFDASASVPGSSPISTYEWDFDYDGSNFTVDATGVTVDHAFTLPGTPTVALRVSDGSIPGTDIETTIMAILSTPVWTATPFRVTNDSYWNRWEDQSRPCPVIGIDSTGTAHLVHYRAGGPYSIIHHELPACSSTWSVGETAFTHASGGNYGLGLAITSDDRLHVSFVGGGVNNVRLVTKSAGTWLAPVQVTTTPGSGGWNYGWLARNSADELGYAAIFQPPQNPAAVNGNGIPAVPQQTYFVSTASGVWQPQVLLGSSDWVTSFSSPGSYSGRIMSITTTALPSNDWVVVWDSLKVPYTGTGPVSTQCLTKWTRQTSGVFAPEATLSAVPSDSFRDVLVTAPNGTIWWANTAVTNSVQLATYNGTSWSVPQVALTGLSGSAHPFIAFAPDGEGFVSTGGSNWGTAITGKVFQQTDTIAAIAAAPVETVSAAGSSTPTTGLLQRFPVSVRLPDKRWAVVFQDTRYGGFTEGQELEAVFRQ